MRRLVFGTAILMIAVNTGAQATVQIAIDLTRQHMHVTSNGGDYDWPISSARSGFYTPGGNFAPTHLEAMHYSKKYHMSPMPHAIFFRGGYAIHGSYATGSLGRPASHGCVRLSPGHAAALYAMVQHEGARISISGTPPASAPFAVARRRARPLYDQSASYAAGAYGAAPRYRASRYAVSPYDPYGGTAIQQPSSYGYGTGLLPFGD